MLKSISSNNPNFKTVIFKNGFNVIIAEKSKQTKKTDSRNGVGKTTLIDIIHYCLGSDHKKSRFKANYYKGWSFKLKLDIGMEEIELERYVDNPNYVVLSNNFSIFNQKFNYDIITGKPMLEIKELVTFLNKYLYGIDHTIDSDYPTFRQLISYDVRREGGYSTPFKYFLNQSSKEVELCNSYLLNLNVNHLLNIQKYNNDKKQIENYLNALKSKVLDEDKDISNKYLESELISKKNELLILDRQLKSFKVHPQYYEISNNLNSLTDEIHSLVNTLTFKKQLLIRYSRLQLSEESGILIDDIERLYQETGTIFQSTTKNTLENVLKFHSVLIESRKEHLSNEISSLNTDLQELNEDIEKLSNKKSELMKILSTHGALDEYTRLQESYHQKEKETNDLSYYVRNVNNAKDKKSKLQIKIEEEKIIGRSDLSERNILINKTMSYFSHCVKTLYDEAGLLSIEISNKGGYKFDIDVKRNKSEGVNLMKIFCYDLTLAMIRTERTTHTDFLVHDSTIYAGVDSRQIGLSMKLALETCSTTPFQYICFINSDAIPYSEFDNETKEIFEKSIVLKLDDSETGCLLGMRF